VRRNPLFSSLILNESLVVVVVVVLAAVVVVVVVIFVVAETWPRLADVIPAIVMMETIFADFLPPQLLSV